MVARTYFILCLLVPGLELIFPPRMFSPVVKGCNETEIDLVFMLDVSGSSTWAPQFQILKDFIIDFVQIADIDSGNVRVGVVIYIAEVIYLFPFNALRTKADFKAINDISPTLGHPNTADALRTMREEMFTPATGDRPDVPNIAILVTDGVSSINSDRTISEAEQARAEGIHIYAIGIGLEDTTELDGIASKPVEENRFSVQNVMDLLFVKGEVFAKLCAPSLYIVSDDNIYPLLEGTRSVLGCKSPRQLPPNASYTWEDKAGGVTFQQNLIFDNLTTAYHGKRVKCSVSYTINGSSYKVSSDDLELQIYYYPRISITRKDNFSNLVQYHSSDIPVTEGHNMTFRCEADSNPPPASITWSGNVSSSTGDLQILAADQAVHGGVYTCTVVTGTVPGDDRLPLTSSRQITVVVTGPPEMKDVQSQPPVLT